MRLGFWQRLGVVCSVLFLFVYVLYSVWENGDRIIYYRSLLFSEKFSCISQANRSYEQSRSLPTPSGGVSWEQIRENKIKECQDNFQRDLMGEESQKLKPTIDKIAVWISEAIIIIAVFWILIYMILGVVRWVLRGRRT